MTDLSGLFVMKDKILHDSLHHAKKKKKSKMTCLVGTEGTEISVTSQSANQT